MTCPMHDGNCDAYGDSVSNDTLRDWVDACFVRGHYNWKESRACGEGDDILGARYYAAHVLH